MTVQMSAEEMAAYLDRVGLSVAFGSDVPGPTLETLRAVVLAHIEHIPFENLDVLLGRPIRLDEAAIFKKLVTDHRGGYCFEQNGLLLWVLQSLGFDATPISARVRLGRARDFTPARSHAFLRVEIEGHSWLADVGVGGLSPTAPLRLTTVRADSADVQDTPHEPRRLISEPGTPSERLFHQVRIAGEWQDVCEFTLEPMPLIDREVANWYTSAHPQSHFRNRLLVARAGPDGERLTLLNRELTRRWGAAADQRVEVTSIRSPEHLLSVLTEVFGVTLPAGTALICEGLDFTTNS
ncbi:MAG: arylamine N-acetyltransferase [Myxococcales bacterium]|nr:arylamine N-acetyltransferase [Myxococcales bacterium]